MISEGVGRPAPRARRDGVVFLMRRAVSAAAFPVCILDRGARSTEIKRFVSFVCYANVFMKFESAAERAYLGSAESRLG